MPLTALERIKKYTDKNIRQEAIQGFGSFDAHEVADALDYLADVLSETAGGSVDLSSYATIAALNSGLALKAGPSDISTALAALAQPADYLIEIVGSTIYARVKPGSSLTPLSGTDAYTVIQAAIDALTVTSGATRGSRGGKILLGRGVFSLTDELHIIGWENQGLTNPGYSQLCIEGMGKSTKLYQATAGKNGLIIKNNASVAIQKLRIECTAAARSALKLDGTGTDEISVFGGFFDDLYLQANSVSYPAFYAQNFFDVYFGTLTCQNSFFHAMVLENLSTTTLYGNSHFSFVRAIAGSGSPYAGLKVISNNGPSYKALDFVTFGNFECVSGYYGIHITDGINFTFSMVDIEYGTVGLHIGGGTYARHNYVLSGLVSVAATNGVCLEVSAGGNSFHCQLGGGVGAIPIADTQSFEPPNMYDVILTNNNAANITISSLSRTFLRYRDTTAARTFTNFGDNVTVTTPALKDNSTTVANTRYVQQNAARLLAVNNVKVSAPADTTEDILFTATIPGGSIGANGSLHIIPLWSVNNSAGNKTLRVRINGTEIANELYTTTQTVRWYLILSNRNATNSQVSGGVGSIASEGFGTNSGVAPVTYAFDTTASLTITFTAQKSVAGDSASIESLQVIGYY